MTPFDEVFGFEPFDAGDVFAVMTWTFYLIYYLAILGFGVVQYVMQAVGLRTIAKRRGIRHAWLSWLPFGSSWVLGCISDQYQYVAKGKIKNKRKLMLILSVLSGVLGLLFAAGYAVFVIGLAMEYPTLQEPGVSATMSAVFGFLTLMYAAIGVFAAFTVITNVALYHLYASCEPRKRILFLMLSIFMSIGPILVFICRKKDLGMPPRKQAVVDESIEPWENNPET